MQVLAGDIGGTNTRLAVFGAPHDRNAIAFKVYPSKEHASLEEIIQRFFKEVKIDPPQIACFGIAGPVRNNIGFVTNLPWDANGAEISRICNIARVILLNDLEANAHGIFELTSGELTTLNKGVGTGEGSRTLIAPGTGLGEAGLLWSQELGGYEVFATEGGHVSFSADTEKEKKLQQFLQKKYGTFVSWERVLSGQGLTDIHQYCVEILRIKSGVVEVGAHPSRITEEGEKKGGDRACAKTLKIFATLLGKEAGNLALKHGTRRGIYVGGGIAPKIVPALEKWFMDGIRSRAIFQDHLSGIPVHVITNDKAALLGAARVAFQESQE